MVKKSRFHIKTFCVLFLALLCLVGFVVAVINKPFRMPSYYQVESGAQRIVSYDYSNPWTKQWTVIANGVDVRIVPPFYTFKRYTEKQSVTLDAAEIASKRVDYRRLNLPSQSSISLTWQSFDNDSSIEFDYFLIPATEYSLKHVKKLKAMKPGETCGPCFTSGSFGGSFARVGFAIPSHSVSIGYYIVFRRSLLSYNGTSASEEDFDDDSDNSEFDTPPINATITVDSWRPRIVLPQDYLFYTNTSGDFSREGSGLGTVLRERVLITCPDTDMHDRFVVITNEIRDYEIAGHSLWIFFLVFFCVLLLALCLAVWRKWCYKKERHDRHWSDPCYDACDSVENLGEHSRLIPPK